MLLLIEHHSLKLLMINTKQDTPRPPPHPMLQQPDRAAAARGRGQPSAAAAAATAAAATAIVAATQNCVTAPSRSTFQHWSQHELHPFWWILD